MIATMFDAVLAGLVLGVVVVAGVWLWCRAVDAAGGWLYRRWFGE